MDVALQYGSANCQACDVKAHVKAGCVMQKSRKNNSLRGREGSTSVPFSPPLIYCFWAAAIDVPEISDEVAAKTKASVTAAFDEDKHLLEKLQARVAADPRGLDFLEVTLGADGAGIKVRQILNKKLAAEKYAL
ncbi:MAG: hypothetical protein WBN04_09065 [Paracoccaceae bacterium]